jgi:hypothetical protein
MPSDSDHSDEEHVDVPVPEPTKAKPKKPATSRKTKDPAKAKESAKSTKAKSASKGKDATKPAKAKATSKAKDTPKPASKPKKRPAEPKADAGEKRKRRKPVEVPSVIDDFPESDYIGQFTRAARFAKAVRESATVDPDGLLDTDGIPNYESLPITPDQEAAILKAVTAAQVRFSKKSIQFIRWLTQTLLRQSFDEHAVVNRLQKKATLCMDQVVAHQQRRGVCNMSTAKIVRDADEDLSDVCLANFLAAENGNHEKAWKSALGCAKTLKLDTDRLAERAKEMYGTADQPWIASK